MSLSDLSQHHKLLTDFFPAIDIKEAWHSYKLTNKQIAHFEEYGYVSGIRLLEECQVEKLCKELEVLTDANQPLNHLFHEFYSNESGDPDAVLFHSLGHWRISRYFHDLLWNPRFVIPAVQLLGHRTVRFWHDQLFCKPAKHGGVVAWHQDYSYWTRTSPMNHLTCWMGLDNASTENGCLYYIPGSHRWGLLDKPDLAGDMNGLDEYLNDEQKEQFKNKVAIELPKGFGTFHHPLMVHGSYENRSEQSRRACVLNVFADGTTANSPEPLLRGIPSFAAGEKLQGQFFPVLCDVADLPPL